MNGSRAQGRHAGLTRDQVLRAALRLVDRDGAAALSMRKLARELKVEAMTLYHHVRNKQALEDAIVEQVLLDSLPRVEASASWQDVLLGYANGLHQGLVAHPGSVALFATRPGLTTRTSAELEDVLRVLSKAGFAPATGLRIVHAIAGAVIGQHLAQPAEEPGGQAPEGPLDLEELPLVREALAPGMPTIDERLSFTLEALIAGFERLADQPA